MTNGGFGQVYLATRLDRWLREAYFGLLLRDHPRAIRIYDTFPWPARNGRVFYCLALEYARHGDLSAFLERSMRTWAESTVHREIAGILPVLGKLHRGQLLHRDLTPLNVFVWDSSPGIAEDRRETVVERRAYSLLPAS